VIVVAQKLTLALVALIALVGCTPSAPPELRTLGSGKQVAILSVTDTETDSGHRTLHVDYATERSVDDHGALVPEIQDVWAVFLKEAERGHYDTVMISPHAGDSSDVKTTFPITHGDDGKWYVPYVVSLRSGGSVVVVSEQADHDALFVDYATTLPVSSADLCVLAPEVDDVWAEFRAIAEAAGVKKAFISASDKPIGTLIAFAFRRNADGQWSRVTATHCSDTTSPGEAQDPS
jgi:hypothetical protein